MACSTASPRTDRDSAREWRPARSPFVLRRGIAFRVLIAWALILWALGGLALFSAASLEAQPARPACGGATIATGEVARIVDGKTFVLADGREARLAAIEAPPVTPSDPNEEHAAIGLAAKTALEAILLRKIVILRAAGPGFDRYGRLIAEAFVGRDAENWVQYEILTKGYALVAPGGDDATCVTFLRGVERRARASGLGLWGDPYSVMKEAQYPDDVLTELGRFALVGGKVISVNESGAVLYLNFGRRWTESFTVTVAKRNQRVFISAGLDPKQLAGREVEVRGWIEERGGPAIEASRPEQIEIVGRESATPKTATPKTTTPR
jgi:endonuclease YncB( thermonuclease family)